MHDWVGLLVAASSILFWAAAANWAGICQQTAIAWLHSLAVERHVNVNGSFSDYGISSECLLGTNLDWDRNLAGSSGLAGEEIELRGQGWMGLGMGSVGLMIDVDDRRSSVRWQSLCTRLLKAGDGLLHWGTYLEARHCVRELCIIRGGNIACALLVNTSGIAQTHWMCSFEWVGGRNERGACGRMQHGLMRRQARPEQGKPLSDCNRQGTTTGIYVDSTREQPARRGGQVVHLTRQFPASKTHRCRWHQLNWIQPWFRRAQCSGLSD